MRDIKTMHIDIIDDYQTFSGLKENWEAVYAADPEAQFFLSWDWISKWLEDAIKSWVVLAARRDSESSTYEAFLPLRIRVAHTKNGTFYSNVSMACEGLADYMGFLCQPETASQTIPAFAASIQKLKWNSFSMKGFHASDERAKLLLNAFPRSSFKIKKLKACDGPGLPDNDICPYIPLPDDWDTYLENQVSTNTRQKIRRFLRKVESSDDYRITLSTAETIERDISILMKLWEVKWGAVKQPGAARIFNKIFRTMLAHCEDQGILFMPVLWQGDTPLGVLGSLIDPEKKTMLFLVAGRDQAFKSPPSGLVLHAYSIRHAISLGLTTYDFLRGNEPYKYSFGVQEKYLRCVSIDRKVGGKKLDQQCVHAALLLTRGFAKRGDIARAERGFRQILDMAPDNDSARLGLSRVLMAKGDGDAANRLLAEQPSQTQTSSS